MAASFREHSNEHANPIPRPDPVHNHEETQDQVLQSRSEGKNEHSEQGPTVEQPAKCSSALRIVGILVNSITDATGN